MRPAESRSRADILLQPRNQVLHVEDPLLEELDQKVVNRLGTPGDSEAIDAQKDVGPRKSNPFVAIHEWMVLHETLQESGGLMNDRVVVAGLWPMQGRFERAGITDSRGTAVALDQLFVEEEGVGQTDILGHLASDRYNSSLSATLSWNASSTLRRGVC